MHSTLVSDAESSSTTTSRYDLATPASNKLAQPRSKFSHHRTRRLRPVSSSIAPDRVTERRNKLPRIDTSVTPSIHLLPSPRAHSSPTTAPDTSSFPPLLPPIRRETLRELDLEAILGNVQLRKKKIIFITHVGHLRGLTIDIRSQRS